MKANALDRRFGFFQRMRVSSRANAINNFRTRTLPESAVGQTLLLANDLGAYANGAQNILAALALITGAVVEGVSAVKAWRSGRTISGQSRRTADDGVAAAGEHYRSQHPDA